MEIIIVPLKENSWSQPFFGNNLSTAEIITQAMDDFKFSYQNKYITYQRMTDFHSFCGKSRYATSTDKKINGHSLLFKYSSSSQKL